MSETLAHFARYKSIAIMGGTFDPIHYGHLATAEAVRYAFGIEKVVFIPAGCPAHKEQEKVSQKEHRYQMTVLATASNPNFEVSRMELDRPGVTYSVDTVAQIRQVCGEDTKLYFITGADAVHDLDTWKTPERLITLCEFIAVTRPGYQKKDLAAEVGQIQTLYPGKIHYFEVPALEISSSDIRSRIRKGMPVKYLLPETVEEYIQNHHLYGK